MKAATLTLVLVAAGCHHGSPEDPTYDFAGVVFDQSASVDDAGDRADGGGVDGGGGLACDPGAALDGGSAIGSWVVEGGCASADALYQLTATCPAITYSAIELVGPSGGAPTGTLTLFGDTYTRSLDAKLTASAAVPQSCATNGCALYASNTKAELGWLDITCGAEAGGCACVLSTDLTFTAQQGSWAPTAEGFTLSPAESVAQSFIVGVSDDTLVMRGDESSQRGSRGVTLVLEK